MKTKKTRRIILGILLSFFIMSAGYTDSVLRVQAEETVYVTKTGSKYHKRKCGNGTYTPVSLSSAKSRGLSPCEKCYGSGYTEESPSEPQIPEEPSSVYIPEKVFTGCKNIPVEININISGNSSDYFSFRCSDDGCSVSAKKVGESPSSSEGNPVLSLIYALSFDTSGSHKVYVNNKQGQEAGSVIFNISEKHMYDTGVITKKETCENDGEKRFTCNSCKSFYTESIKSSGHDFDSGTETRKASCISEGIKTFKCSKCNVLRTETIPKTGHSFSDWSIIKEPTALDEGEEETTCAGCGEKETRSVKKLSASVELGKKKIRISSGKSVTLRVKNKTHGDFVSSWRTSDKKVISLKGASEKCVIKALKRGRATVTLEMESGCMAKCVVIVK